MDFESVLDLDLSDQVTCPELSITEETDSSHASGQAALLSGQQWCSGDVSPVLPPLATPAHQPPIGHTSAHQQLPLCPHSHPVQPPNGAYTHAPAQAPLHHAPQPHYGGSEVPQLHFQPFHHGPGAAAPGHNTMPSAFTSNGAKNGFHVGTLRNPAAGGAGGVPVGINRRGRKPKPRMEDLQQQVDALSERFLLLSRENGFLRNKLKALERIMPQRDEKVGFLASIQSAQRQLSPAEPMAWTTGEMLAATAPPAVGNVRAAAPPPAGDLAAAGPGSGAPLGEAASAAAGAAAAAARAECSHGSPTLASPSTAAGSGLQHGLAAGGNPAANHAPQPATTAAAGPGLGPGSAPQVSAEPALGAGAWSSGPPEHPPGTPLVLALCPGPDGEVPALTPAAVEELKRVTPQDFCKLWKHITMQLAVLLTSAEAMGPASPQAARLDRYVHRLLTYIDRICSLAPLCYTPCMYLNLETGQHERPSDDFWYALGTFLDLTPQQVEEIDSIAVMYERSVAGVLQERASLSSQLSHTIASSGVTQRAFSAEGLTALSAVDELAQRLERTVIRERQAYIDIEDFLCWSVLTPKQLAKVFAAAYPYIPDGIAMMHAFQKAKRERDLAAQAPGAVASSERGGSSSGAAQAAPS